MRRAAAVLRALAAILALSALLVGLPVLLITAVGWPLPHQLPHLQEIADTLGGHQPLETATVWKVLAIILWLAWLQIAAAAANEAVAALRGSMPRAIPGLHLGHGLVAPLVAAVIVAWPAGSAGRAAAAPVPVAAASSPPPTAPTTAAPASTPPPPVAAPAPATTIHHVVQRRDTLWDLAQRYLGDGYRATELFELNRGQPQPDGGALTDPGVIRPGWVLRIPRPDTPAAAGAMRTVTVAPGETLWEIAEDQLHDGHRYEEIADLNAGRRQPDGDVLTDPDLIRPGWTLELPADAPTVTASPATPAPTTEAPASPEPPPAAPTAPSSPDPATPPEQPARADGSTPDRPPAGLDAEHEDDGSSIPAGGLAALGIGAAGLVAALERRRRVHQRRRERGERPAPLSTGADTAERQLRSVVRARRPDVVEVAVRAAAAGRPQAFDLIDHVEVRDDDVVIVLRDGVAPPDGFVIDRDERRWRTAVDADELARTAAEVSPLPALLPVGRGADGTELLIDGEADGVLFLRGEPGYVERMVRAIAAVTATASWLDSPDIVVVSDDPTLTHLAASPATDLDDALARAERRVRSVTDALRAVGVDSVRRARLASATPEVFAPVVVISTVPPTSNQLERLGRLAAAPGGAVVVTPVDQPPGFGRFVTMHGDGSVTVDGLQTTRPGVVDDQQAAAIAELFESAAISTSTPPAVTGAGRSEPPTPGLLVELLSEVDVLVRVLGEVHCVRRRGETEEPLVPSKQKSLEAIVYLALRETAVDRDDLQAALWPAGANSAKTFHNAVWEARRMLGPSAEGHDLLPEPSDGRYQLSDRVVTDYGVLHELVASAAEADDPEVAASLLTEALELVRGEPFTGAGRSYAWVAPHAGIMVAEVVDAAEELAAMRLAAGDWRGAEWAARQGLKVFPSDERLYRLLMRAAHHSGNTAAVQRVFSELVAAVADPDDGVEPDDTVHPETIALLEELTGRARRASA
jgi:DNA-binding SARP family transcriptional activator/LysM repeat protein